MLPFPLPFCSLTWQPKANVCGLGYPPRRLDRRRRGKELAARRLLLAGGVGHELTRVGGQWPAAGGSPHKHLLLNSSCAQPRVPLPFRAHVSAIGRVILPQHPAHCLLLGLRCLGDVCTLPLAVLAPPVQWSGDRQLRGLQKQLDPGRLACCAWGCSASGSPHNLRLHTLPPPPVLLQRGVAAIEALEAAAAAPGRGSGGSGGRQLT